MATMISLSPYLSAENAFLGNRNHTQKELGFPLQKIARICELREIMVHVRRRAPRLPDQLQGDRHLRIERVGDILLSQAAAEHPRIDRALLRRIR